MVKKRISPTILKPVIDEETALRFALADKGQASEPSTDEQSKLSSKQTTQRRSHDDGLEKNLRHISITVSKRLYDRIAKEAARKNRTVEEHLQKHITKHYEK